MVDHSLPERLEPQLAVLTAGAPAGPDWLHEIKLDGYRILCRLSNGTARLFSRNGLDWTHRFREVAEALRRVNAGAAWLDGEMTVVQPDGVTSFVDLQQALAQGRPGGFTYYLFDAPFLHGQDLRLHPLRERKAALAALLGGQVPGVTSGTRSPLRYLDHVADDGEMFYGEVCRLGLEGIVSKRADGPYRAGRHPDWRKAKCRRRQEFVIGGYTDLAHGEIGFGALLVGLPRDEGTPRSPDPLTLTLKYAGRVGTGFSESLRRTLGLRLQGLRTETCPFAPIPTRRDARPVHWVRPELVAEVAFTEWTVDGRLRHPAFLGLRADKDAAMVQLETNAADPATSDPATSDPATSDPATSATTAATTAPGAPGWHLTNPDKLLYPEAGITKADVALYFATVAGWMLPEVANRPLSLVRCPDGHGAGCFYQKHAPKRVPPGLQAVTVPEHGEPTQYLAVTAPEGLISLAQMGVLEVHIWGARADAPDRPDRLVFDLDPDAGLPWHAVAAAALNVRRRLQDLGLAAFLRATGGKGLHLVLPLVPDHGWDAVRAFSRALAEDMAREDPSLYTASPSLAARRGRIYIDHLRNAPGATAVASYSPRARAGAPVAVPLDWVELDPAAGPPRYTIRTLPERLRSLRGDPWAGYAGTRQSLPTGTWEQKRR